MKKQQLIKEYINNHLAFTEYIHTLSDEDFMRQRMDKWTPGQQLDHILKCLKPMAGILSMKEVLVSKFGKIDRPCMSKDAVLEMYTKALANGGKAPERFVPEKVELHQKEGISKELKDNLNLLEKSMDNYSEEELDSLIIPHPLLGNLTIGEMLYLMSVHVVHHQEKTKQNLL